MKHDQGKHGYQPLVATHANKYLHRHGHHIHIAYQKMCGCTPTYTHVPTNLNVYAHIHDYQNIDMRKNNTPVPQPSLMESWQISSPSNQDINKIPLNPIHEEIAMPRCCIQS